MKCLSFSRVSALVSALFFFLVFSSCGGGGSAGGPSNLSYSSNPATYTVGTNITPNVPGNNGGIIGSYTVSPALPQGLAMDPGTGIISGIPASVTATASYTISGSNGAGSATVTLVITVNSAIPVISYSPNPAVFPVNVEVFSEAPVNTGGPVTLGYTISPTSLPTGLSFNTSTGAFSGTPTVVTSPAAYTITGKNTGGTATTTITVGVGGPFYLIDGNAGGSVNAMMTMANVLFLGGTFNFVGPYRGHGGILSSSNGSMSVSNYPVINGVINAVAGDPANPGAFYIGGNFTSIGDTARNYLAYINADGSLNTNFAPAVSSPVTAFFVTSTVIYVASSASASAGTLAAYNTADGSAHGAFTSGSTTGGPINAMSLIGANLYFGGSFTNYASTGRIAIASVNATTGALQAWNPLLAGGGPSVSAITGDGTYIYFGGNFSSVNSTSSPSLAAVNSSGVLQTWVSGATGTVGALFYDGTNIYVGGNFTNLGGTTQNAVGQVGVVGSATVGSWNPLITGSVTTLYSNGTNVYIGGSFRTANAIARSNFLMTSATAATTFSASNPGFSDQINALAVSASNLFVGGNFGSFSMTPRSNAASIDPSTGQILSWNPNVNGPVTSLAGMGSTVYIGGNYTTVNGTTRYGLAAVDPSAGTVTGWNPSQTSGNIINGVAASADGTTVYAAGSFSTMGANSQARANLAAINSTSGFVTTWNPNPNGIINAIDLVAGALYVGGNFTSIGATPVTQSYAASLDVIVGNANAWNPAPNGQVYAITNQVGGNPIFVGGNITTFNSTARVGMASVDATSGALTSGFNANLSAGAVVKGMSMNSLGTELFIGGNFTTAGGLNQTGLVGVVAGTGAADTSFLPSLNGNVLSVLSFTFGSINTVFAGGTFTQVQNGPKYTAGFAAVSLPSGVPR